VHDSQENVASSSAKGESILIIGGDSLIGGRLLNLLKLTNQDVIETSRRKSRIDSKCIFFDLHDPEITPLPTNCRLVIFCAAMTSMAACEADPVKSKRTNVSNTLDVASALHKKGARIVYLSSNTVFDGNSLSPIESCPYSPSTEYGRQKMAVEQGLLSLPASSDSVAVVRFSKVVSADQGMVKKMISRMLQNQVCTAFSDLLISPVSLDYATSALLKIARSSIGGIFHISGKDEISYADFGVRLAIALGAARSLIQRNQSDADGIQVPFKPTHPALGMHRSRKLLGLEPEGIDKTVYSILNEKFFPER
jgi:dTDP-4-dehydrorhamnose reductase